MTAPIDGPDRRARELRHAPRSRPFALPEGDSHIEEIEVHLEAHLGKVENVFHELLSDLVHIDVLSVPPSERCPWLTLVTSGMSDLPMTVPEDNPVPRRAELMIQLPPDWPLGDAAFEDEANYWPVRHLKMLALMPHELETWLEHGQTVATDPPAPVVPGADYCGWLVADPAADELRRLVTADGIEISFLQAVPLLRDQLDVKLQHGANALLQHLQRQGPDWRVVQRVQGAVDEKERAARRRMRIAGLLLVVTAIADPLFLWWTGGKIGWGRFALSLSLAWYVADDSRIARWIALVLLPLGMVGGIVILARATRWDPRLLYYGGMVGLWGAALALLLSAAGVGRWLRRR